MSESIAEFDPLAERRYQECLQDPRLQNSFLELLDHNPDSPTSLPLHGLMEPIPAHGKLIIGSIDNYMKFLALGLYRRTVSGADSLKLRPANIRVLSEGATNNPYYALTKGTHGRVSEVNFTTLPVDEETAVLAKLPKPREIQVRNIAKIGLSGRVQVGGQSLVSSVETIVAIREGEKSLSFVLKSIRDPEIKEKLAAIKERAARCFDDIDDVEF